MNSVLYLTEFEKLQKGIIDVLKVIGKKKIIYVSLNKDSDSTSSFLRKGTVELKNTFFIDGVSLSKDKEVVHISPSDIRLLEYCISSFVKELGEDTLIIIDSLATMLIYNEINKVVRFVKNINELTTRNNVTLLAFSPKSEENLLEKIYNFFDEVKGK